MRSLHYHFSGYDSDEDLRMKRHFLKIFTTKRRRVALREGVMSPEELKERVISIGRGKKVDITRMAYDGKPEEPPIAVKLIDIGGDHFTGKVINVDRSISESQDTQLIFLKGGGGTIDFRYDDGDILRVDEDIDEEIVQQRNVEEVREILEALDLDEDINISFYDKNEGGVINGAGKLIEKNMESGDFKITLHLINEIELKRPQDVSLNLDRDEILDLEVVI
jgi:hypothetical protein